MSLLNSLLDAAFAPIKSIVLDPTVTDILMYGPDDIVVKRMGMDYQSYPGVFENAGAYQVFCRQLARVVEKDIGAAGGKTRTVDINYRSLRIHINTYTSPHFSVAIRKTDSRPKNFDFMIKHRTLCPDIRDYLGTAVRQKESILVAGRMHTAKTTMIKCMIDTVGPMTPISCIEDTGELKTNGKRAFWMEAAGDPLQPLLRSALRQNAEWIVVGEIRGPEAAIFLLSLFTGHAGMSSIHAGSAGDAIFQLANFAAMDGSLQYQAALRMAAISVDLVVLMDRLDDQRIVVSSIERVTGPGQCAPPGPTTAHDNGAFQTTKIFSWNGATKKHINHLNFGGKP